MIAVAVAVASYNHAPYVEQCLRSIVEQDYPPIDLCWVDDRSSDDTFARISALLEDPQLRSRFRRVALRRNSVNRGAAFSLNLAARLSDSPFLSFMNSDDFYAPTRLTRLIELLDWQKAGFAFSNVMPVDAAGRSMVTDPVGQRIAFDADIIISRLGSPSAALLSRQIASSTGNFVVTRLLFDTIGGFRDLKYCHDWAFALHATLITSPVFCAERLYNYRLHLSNSFKSLGFLAEAETFEVLRDFYVGKALSSASSKPCLQTEPASFWSLARETSTSHVAERIFFPYARRTRLLADHLK